MADNFGRVTINGKEYIERVQHFPQELTVTVALSVIPGRVALPGQANFLLKALARVNVAAAVPAVRLFRFRLGNSDGSTWYTAGGIGGTTDRVLDPLIFGTGQFPYVLTPPIFYSSNASIQWEVEDVSGAAGVPYTIFMDFIGSYLLPIS